MTANEARALRARAEQAVLEGNADYEILLRGLARTLDVAHEILDRPGSDDVETTEDRLERECRREIEGPVI